MKNLRKKLSQKVLVGLLFIYNLGTAIFMFTIMLMNGYKRPSTWQKKQIRTSK